MNLSKKFYRPDEVAALLALSRRTIYRMIHDGRLQAVKWGSGPWRIPQEALTATLGGGHGG
ncbi:MAG: DNA-binding protein [Deltaproteobacteria bacterium]|nr:MAG: DNA-binding protein [Deltaproteobacteria bacterium]